MEEIKVLDHGYVRLVETYGQDSSIIEAARMSTNKGFNGWGEPAKWKCSVCKHEVTVEEARYMTTRGTHKDTRGQWVENNGIVFCPSPNCLDTTMIEGEKTAGDEKLLKFLYDNKHATPFEFAGMIIEVQAPIFVFREWHRHRTQSYNEMSARYTPLPDFNYVPTVDRLFMGSDKNKQASTKDGADPLDQMSAGLWLGMLEEKYSEIEELYQLGLQAGIPKEVTRVCLPVGRYSRMRASANLRNWLGFLTLRMAPQAQWEIRQYAKAVGELIADNFPKTWELFDLSRDK